MAWVRRRVVLVRHALRLVIGLLPEQLERCVAEVVAVRTRLETDSALMMLRELSAAQLRVFMAVHSPYRAESACRSHVAPSDAAAHPCAWLCATPS